MLFSLKFYHSAQPVLGLSQGLSYWDNARFWIVWAGVFRPVCFLVVYPLLVFVLFVFSTEKSYHIQFIIPLCFTLELFNQGGGGGGGVGSAQTMSIAADLIIVIYAQG